MLVGRSKSCRVQQACSTTSPQPELEPAAAAEDSPASTPTVRDQPAAGKMTDTRRRVKLYELNAERQWDDKGTGTVVIETRPVFRKRKVQKEIRIDTKGTERIVTI